MLWKKAVLFGVLINILMPATLLAQFGVGYNPNQAMNTLDLERENQPYEAWVRLPSPIAEGDLAIIESASGGGDTMFVASRLNLYRTANKGGSWERILSLSKGESSFNAIAFNSSSQGVLYAATSEGLFCTNNLGRSWYNIYRGIGEKANDTCSVFVDPADERRIFVGTKKGLFHTEDDGASWTKQKGKLGDSTIAAIADAVPNQVWVATPYDIYQSIDGGESFTLSFSIPFARAGEKENSDVDTDSQGAEHAESITKIAAAPYPETKIYVATSRGVFEAEGTPPQWKRLPLSGLRSVYVEDIVVLPKNGALFIATQKGIYTYKSGERRWEELYNGLPANDIKALSLAGENKETLIALTKEGLFQLSIEDPGFQAEPVEIPYLAEKLDYLKSLIEKEPTVLQLQQAAVRYAHVDNGKIAWWHIASRLRALVPSISVDRNQTISTNVDLDRGSTKDPDKYILGPDNTYWYKNFEVKWDLANLIWSSSQTSIDSREKLMVELRDEILSDVTRLYFERRRLLMMLILEPQQTVDQYLDLRLRIDELTAHLDALTDGYLSRELEKKEIYYGKYAAICDNFLQE